MCIITINHSLLNSHENWKKNYTFLFVIIIHIIHLFIKIIYIYIINNIK